jgi:hypothetical protein
MKDDNRLISLERFYPGDFVKLRFLSYKSEYYDFLVDYQNTDTCGMVLEAFDDYLEPTKSYYNFAEMKVKVLIGEKIVITSAQDWVKA